MIRQSNNGADMPRSLIILLATACGIAVANIYYNQPLLMLFVDTFHCTIEQASLIASSIQFAYAAGLLLFVPLGDKVNHHQLILGLIGINVMGLILAAISSSFNSLLIANILIGLTSVSAQIIIPAVSLSADPAKRGKIVGSVMSGLFAGVLLARTISGFVGEYAGWRAMYLLAVLLDIFLAIVIFFYLPQNATYSAISYPALLRSMWDIFWKEPVLRVACLSGFFLFAAFSALWGSLAFLLAKPPYEFGSEIVGMFGLVGILGIFASSSIGMLADKMGGKKVVITGAILTALAFMLVWQAQFSLWFLLLSMAILDLGGRAGMIGNQMRIFNLAPEVRSRMNTIFMSSYFIGGALGTRLGAIAAAHHGWLGVGVLGAAIGTFVILFMSLGVFKTCVFAGDN